MEKPVEEEPQQYEPIGPIVTRDDVCQFTQKFTVLAREKQLSRNVIQDLYFYGNVGPVPLKHNHIKVIRNETGQSVIATEDIPANVIITHFPVHGMTNGDFLQLYETEEKDHVFADKVESRYAKTHSHFMPIRRNDGDTRDGYIPEGTPSGILLIGNPNNVENRLLLGHVIREAYESGNVFKGTSFEDIRTWITFKNKCAIYYMNARKNRNCRFVINRTHSVLSVETTREIKAGEELRVLHGPEHWFHRQYNKQDKKNVGDYLFELLSQDKDFTKWVNELYQ